MTVPPVFDAFEDLVRLEPHGSDVFVGLSPEYPWGRVYGGQVVAQALEAAVETIEEIYRPHSLHAYFIRGGSSKEPIRYEVDRIRNGRSFVTRRVVARQSNGAIFNMSASFHVAEEGLDIMPKTMPPDIPGPEDLDDESWTPLHQRRRVPANLLEGRTAIWIRVTGPLGSTAAANESALAYASDDVPYDAAASVHPRRSDVEIDPDMFMGASLDHAVWFHRDAPADMWQLHVLEPLGYTGSRGLAFGQVFSESGVHLASVAQEIVLREAR